MKKTIICLIVSFLSFNLFAIDDIKISLSPTERVTGVFQEPIDQYLDVIEFNKLDTKVLFLEFNPPGVSSDSSFDIGVGHRFNDNFYLAGNLSLANLGKDGDATETLGADSEIIPDNQGNPTGRTDEIEYEFIESGNLEFMTNLLAGLKLGAFSLGIKSRISYDQDTENSGAARTSGSFNGDNRSGKVFLDAALNAFDLTTLSIGQKITFSDNLSTVMFMDETTTNYDIDGNATDKTSIIYGNDGYINSSRFSFSLEGGTQLDLTKYILDLRFAVYLNSYDKSKRGDRTEYSTNYDASLPTYEDLVGIYSHINENAAEVNEYANTGINLYSTTEIKLNEKFKLGFGLGNYFYFDVYKDGGITTTYNSVDYSTAINTTNNIFVDTTTVTNNFKTVDSVSSFGNFLYIPVTITSTFGNKFEFAIKNELEYISTSKTVETSGTNKKTTTVSSTDTTFVDTIGIVDTTYTDYKSVTTVNKIIDTINIGAKFFLTEKLRINLGSNLKVAPISNTVINRSNSGNGSETTTTTDALGTYQTSTTTTSIDPNLDVNGDNYASVTSTNNSGESVVGDINYKAGLTYFFNQDMFLDLYMTGSGDIWDSASWSLLMTVRY